MSLSNDEIEKLDFILKAVNDIVDFIKSGAPHSEIGKFTETTLKKYIKKDATND